MRGKWRAQRANRGTHAARGFVGGATKDLLGNVVRGIVSMPHAALWVVQQQQRRSIRQEQYRFNAARGFVGSAAPSLSALVPLRGKSPFEKSPEI